MMDTSALVAALVADHEHHAPARRHLHADLRLPVIVIAESFSQMRRTFGQSARSATRLLAPWSDADHLLPTTVTATTRILERCAELDIAGNIHDALIAQVCHEAGVGLVTLDGRQHRIALALGAASTYLLA